MPTITADLKARLYSLGVSTLHANNFYLPDDTEFEPPCALKWMSAHYRLRIGAFSYAVSGYYFGAEIGRYVSIGEAVQIGRGSHPLNWLSSSPVFYQNRRDVLNLEFDLPKPFEPKNSTIRPQTTKIGNDVYIGHGALLMPGIIVGDGAVIGAGAVVTKDVPPYAVVAGNPATIKKMRFPEYTAEKLGSSRWWEYAFWDLSGMSHDQPEIFLAELDERIAQGLTRYEPEKIKIGEFLRGSEYST